MRFHWLTVDEHATEPTPENRCETRAEIASGATPRYIVSHKGTLQSDIRSVRSPMPSQIPTSQFQRDLLSFGPKPPNAFGVPIGKSYVNSYVVKTYLIETTSSAGASRSLEVTKAVPGWEHYRFEGSSPCLFRKAPNPVVTGNGP
jgi:hypothetical protein